MKIIKTITILISISVCLIGCAHSKNNAEHKVRADLADMFEKVVSKAKALDKSLTAIRIGETSETYLIIDKINDIDVCNKDAEHYVVLLQQLFEEQPCIDRNVGPYIFAYFEDNGQRRKFNTKQLQSKGTISECPQIYISVRK